MPENLTKKSINLSPSSTVDLEALEFIDSDKKTVYDLTFLEPHVWIKPILKKKSSESSRQNSRCTSRPDRPTLEFKEKLTDIKEFKKDKFGYTGEDCLPIEHKDHRFDSKV